MKRKIIGFFRKTGNHLFNKFNIWHHFCIFLAPPISKGHWCGLRHCCQLGYFSTTNFWPMQNIERCENWPKWLFWMRFLSYVSEKIWQPCLYWLFLQEPLFPRMFSNVLCLCQTTQTKDILKLPMLNVILRRLRWSKSTVVKTWKWLKMQEIFMVGM